MERRDFLKLASMAGLGVVAAGSLSRDATAADPYTGPLFIMVNAGGGWDPTYLCDPKGSVNEAEQDAGNRDSMNHNYLASEIPTAGRNIRYAPVSDQHTSFFDKYASRLLVLNGIDTGTNSHDAGSRTTWSGTLREGKPAFAALVAAVYGATLPMGFISNGGYDTSANTVSVTRMPSTDLLARLAYPNEIDPMDENTERFHSEATFKRIVEARDARHAAKLEHQRLPQIQQAMSTLYTSRLGQNELKQLIPYLPAEFERANLKRQAQLALAACKAKICISANLSIGGFDTHGNHDQNQIPLLAEICEGVDFIMTEAEKQGLSDRVVVVVGSDFGRTPGYNDGRGKDHWNITSMMMLGANIPGDRVIGKTTERHSLINIDPATLQPTENGGVRLTTGHIHKALRKLAGIDASPIVQRFPLAEEEDLAIFG
jgi:hypothetical protein